MHKKCGEWGTQFIEHLLLPSLVGIGSLVPQYPFQLSPTKFEWKAMIGLKFRLYTNEDNLSLLVTMRGTIMGRLTAIKHGSGIDPIRTKLRRLMNDCGKKDVPPSGYEQEGGFLLLATKRWTLLSGLHKIYFN